MTELSFRLVLVLTILLFYHTLAYRCMLGNIVSLLSSAVFFFLQKSSFRNSIRVSNSLDPDQARRKVGPDLDPNCLDRLSADDTRVEGKELIFSLILVFPGCAAILLLGNLHVFVVC